MTREKRWRYLTGVVLGLVPYGYVTILAGPQQVLNNLVLFPVFHSSPGRHIPIFSVKHFLLGLFAMHLVAVGLIITAGVVSIWRDRTDSAARLLLGLGLLGLGLTHQAAQRLDIGHMVAAAVISSAFLPVAIFVLYRKWRSRPADPSLAFLAFGLVAVTLQLVVPGLGIATLNRLVDSVKGEVHYAVFVEHRGRSFPVASMSMAVEVDALLKRLEAMAAPGQRLFVGPADLRRTNYNDTFIYHLMPQLQPATYFLEMNPMSANRPDSRLAADVASADWLVLSHLWDDWNEKNDSMKLGPDAPMQVVQTQFELCGRYDDYDLYRRRVPLALRD
jgi:hypothetical protein